MAIALAKGLNEQLANNMANNKDTWAWMPNPPI
jgi:hypothetical protein